MDITLDQAKALDAAARLGSFTRAAQHLGKGHTAVLYLIKTLEENLGLKLFQRSKYRTKLTPAGKLIWAECQKIIASERQLLNTCNEITKGWETELKIVLDGMLPVSEGLNVVEYFQKRGIPTRVFIFTEFFSAVEEKLVQENADFMFSLLSPERVRMESVNLPPLTTLLVASSSHPLAAPARKFSEEMLRSHTLLTLRGAEKDLGLSTAGLENGSKVHFGDYFSLRAAILGGLGYGWIPEHLIRKELKRNTLKVISWEKPSSHVYSPRVFHHGEKVLGRAARIILAEARKRARKSRDSHHQKEKHHHTPEGIIDEGSILLRCVENSNDAIMLTDIRGNLFYVNESWQRMYGYCRDEAIGKTPRLIRSAYQPSLFYQKMWDDILNPAKGYWKGELLNRTKDGREIPVLLTITPFKDHSDNIAGYMGIALDMSEKKKMEAELIQKDRLASIGLLASGLAHEMGTPLGTIRGRAECLLRESQEAGVPSAHAASIISQVDRISKLMRALLDLARPDASQASDEVVARGILEDVFHLFSEKLESHRISYEADLTPQVKARTTKERFGQVVLNLMTNSVHAIQTAIEAGRPYGHRIRISKKERKGQWEIHFQDTGCGMTDEVIANLYRPFFTTRPVGSGMGLGLPLSRQIAESWGGGLTIESALGVGTNVRMILPRY